MRRALNGRQLLTLLICVIALIWSLGRALFEGPAHVGLTALMILLSALLWLAGSIYAEFPRMRPLAMGNLFNAMAASFAAVAGVMTLDHGAVQVTRWVTGRPAARYDGSATPDRTPASPTKP